MIIGLWLKKGDFGEGFCESEAKKYSYCALAHLIARENWKFERRFDLNSHK